MSSIQDDALSFEKERARFWETQARHLSEDNERCANIIDELKRLIHQLETER